MRPLACLAFALCLVGSIRGAAAQENLEAEVKDLTWVGFQKLGDATRVFVKTTEPVKYSVDKRTDGLVVLVLDNTRVPLVNNTRPLPTSYFGTPVRHIEVKPIEGPSPSVRIEIHTRGKAAYTPMQKDTMLALDFPPTP